MTDLTPEKLSQLQTRALKELAAVSDAAALEAWRVKYLGRKGAVPLLLRGVKDLSAEEKKVVGQTGNQLRQALEQKYSQLKRHISTAQNSADNMPTAYYLLPATGNGHLHPLTLTIRRIQKILSDMGFVITEGPLVEDPGFNFDQLNIPLEHPTRSETDTFYLTAGQVLRTHTSPVQLRAVLQNRLQPPFRIFSPGRVFRAERTDATHEATFYQFEGLMVGTDVSLADLKRDVEQFYSKFFDQAVQSRLRTSFFPFVEPGLEVDISCVFCGGKGCRVCKQTGWIEMMGAGMVHPNVLRNMNIDPAKYQGYAFGGAVDRLAMLRYGVSNIRSFWSGNFNFLKQFS
ncbi:MAG: phenylalanine--tRNA ligase subunit alpha [bacterium]|nr:phenylalanine--tRNA ligase subunit alpha [bacterium]